LLLVTQFYPPSIETAGVRPAAVARHLRAGGHQLTVLTSAADGRLPSDPEVGVTRTWDLQQLRSARTRHSNPETDDTYSAKPHLMSRILVPDPWIVAWAPFGVAAARRLARHHTFDCVITTSPPESVHLVGAYLRRRGIAWLADLRDGWGFEPHNQAKMWPTEWQHRLSRWMERQALRRADAVTAVTTQVVEDLRDRLGIAAHLVPNGWEPEPGAPEPGTLPPLDPNRVTAIFTGKLAAGQKDSEPLIAALAGLAENDPESAKRLELIFAGSFTDEERRSFATDVAPARVVQAGRLDRAAVTALQRQADAALLITSATRSQESGSKLFEYIGAGLPILALARSDSAAAEIVSAANGLVVPTHDVGAIEEGLRALAHGRVGTPSDMMREAYSWPVLSERLVEVAREAISRTGSATPPSRL
jgi:glycosyltransferase involved in cell wall biosynthesis